MDVSSTWIYMMCLVLFMCNRHHVRRIDLQHQSHRMMMHAQQNCIIQSIGSFIQQNRTTLAQSNPDNARQQSSIPLLAGMGWESIAAAFLHCGNSQTPGLHLCKVTGWHIQSPVHPMAIVAMLGPSVGIVHSSIHQQMVDLQPSPWRPWGPWRP